MRPAATVLLVLAALAGAAAGRGAGAGAGEAPAPAGAAAGAPGGPAPGEPRGFLLQVRDPTGSLVGGQEVRVRVAGSGGETRDLVARDDGRMPDTDAGDGIFTAPVPSFPHPSVHVEVLAGTRRWTADAALDRGDPHPVLRLRLEAGGRAIVEPLLPPAGPRGEDAGAPKLEVPALGGRALLLWVALLGGLGAGLGLALGRALRRPVRPARLDPAPPPGEAGPARRLSRDAARALPAGEWADRRVVVLGEAEGALHRVAEPSVLPEELVAALEDLALRPGPPVALLVEAPDRLEPRRPGADATAELERLVAGRFPLAVAEDRPR